jgi:hypothetical protein
MGSLEGEVSKAQKEVPIRNRDAHQGVAAEVDAHVLEQAQVEQRADAAVPGSTRCRPSTRMSRTVKGSTARAPPHSSVAAPAGARKKTSGMVHPWLRSSVRI